MIIIKPSPFTLCLMLTLTVASACTPDQLSGQISPSPIASPDSSAHPFTPGGSEPVPERTPASPFTPIPDTRPSGNPDSLASPRPVFSAPPGLISIASPTPGAVLAPSSSPVMAVGFFPGPNTTTLSLNDALGLETSTPAATAAGRPRSMIYLGHTVTNAELTFRLSPSALQPPNNVQVYSGNGALLATLDSNYPATATQTPIAGTPATVDVIVSVPGNYVYLIAGWNGQGTRPDLTLRRIRTNFEPGVFPVPLAMEMQDPFAAFTPGSTSMIPLNRVLSLPVRLNTPTFVYAPPDTTAPAGKQSYFMSLHSDGSKVLDFEIRGQGELIVGDNDSGFLLPGSDLGLDKPVTATATTSAGVSFKPVSPPRKLHLVTVSADEPLTQASLNNGFTDNSGIQRPTTAVYGKVRFIARAQN